MCKMDHSLFCDRYMQLEKDHLQWHIPTNQMFVIYLLQNAWGNCFCCVTEFSIHTCVSSKVCYGGQTLKKSKDQLYILQKEKTQKTFPTNHDNKEIPIWPVYTCLWQAKSIYLLQEKTQQAKLVELILNQLNVSSLNWRDKRVEFAKRNNVTIIHWLNVGFWRWLDVTFSLT